MTRAINGSSNFAQRLSAISKVDIMRKASGILCVWVIACSAIAAPEMVSFWDNYDARKAPLNVEIVRQWETDRGTVKLVRFDLGHLNGSNKSASPVIAAYYGYPKGAKKVPAVVNIHGGGQFARRSRVESWMELGVACISINWGGKILEQSDTPNTEWDGLAAGFVRPGITKSDELDHHNVVQPGRNTLYKEPHLLNSSWMLIAMSARRAITFLEQSPEVDADKIGMEGHSMGGRSTVLTAIDPRIKAASPSVGGSGFLYQDIRGLPGSARRMTPEDGLELYEKTVSAQVYWPHIKAPILFLGACNDFNSPTESVIRGMSLLPPQTERILALAPHLNHRFTTGTDNARFYWMTSHLQDRFDFPKTSRSSLQLETEDNVPVFLLDVDRSSGLPVEKVEIYYGYARDPRIRFWRSAEVVRKDNHAFARCPVFDVNEPLFAFANITYKAPYKLPARPGRSASDLLTVTSEYRMAYPDELKAVGVQPSEKPDRLVDDFARGMQDWYILNAGNAHHWFYATRKLLDPAWMGPEGARLVVELDADSPGNTMAVGVEVNAWQSYTGRRKDTFHAMADLPKKGLNVIELTLDDFRSDTGETLKDWDEITELFFTPLNRIRSNRATKENWIGAPPTLKNVYWAGGRVIDRPHPHQPRG